VNRFDRIGLNYRFAPNEVKLVLDFTRPDRDGTSWEVAVRRQDGRHVFTRRINLLSSPSVGNIKALVSELVVDQVGERTLLERLLREACESVLASHRNGQAPFIVEGHVVRPPDPAWLCRGLLLKDKPNCWLGAASTGKSTLAKAVCAYVAAGFRFLDRETEQTTPLYLDWEDDHESFERTVYDICRNLGVWPLPRMLWLGMHGHRLRDRVEMLGALIAQERVGLMVVDAVAASGGSPGEHMTYESIALEMADCLDVLPRVTVLALDHVTGAEHKAIALGRAPVPIKARGSERKLEYFRNQWSLVTDVEAEQDGQHVVEWTHTKYNLGKKEREGFATEILHREQELAINVRAKRMHDEEPQGPSEDTKAYALLEGLGGGRSPRELALQVDGHEPSDSRIRSVRTTLERYVRKGLVERDDGPPVRYRRRQPGTPEGVLIPFPRTPA